MSSMIDAYVAVSEAMENIERRAARKNAKLWQVQALAPFSTELSRIQAPVIIGGSVQQLEYDMYGLRSQRLMVDNEPVGTIEAPDVQKLKCLAKASPFGRGNETVFDESVRKAMEITSDRLQINCSEAFFQASIGDFLFLRQVNDKMAPRFMQYEAKLHKLTIYENGGFFEEHVDTLHAPNHLATALVCLPVKHEGGALLVSKASYSSTCDSTGSSTTDHSSDCYRLDFSPNSDNSIQWCAFYTDCKHKVEPVTSGTRIILQYDLFAEREDDEENDRDLQTKIMGAKHSNLSISDTCSIDNEQSLESIRQNLSLFFSGQLSLDNHESESHSYSGSNSDSDDDQPSRKKVKITKMSGTDKLVNRLAFLLCHRYRAGSVVPELLKGSDTILYNYLESHAREEYQLCLTPILMFTSEDIYEHNRTSTLVASPFSDQYILENRLDSKDGDSSDEEEEQKGRTILIPGSKQAALECLKHVPGIEHTGNEAQDEQNFYYGAALVITPKGYTNDE